MAKKLFTRKGLAGSAKKLFTRKGLAGSTSRASLEKDYLSGFYDSFAALAAT